MYIHERTDWTNFKWDSNRIMPVLSEVRYLQGRLLGKMESLGFEFTEQATLESLVLDVVDSSKIEGEFLKPDLVRSSVAKRLGIESGIELLIPKNIDGIVDVVLDATLNANEALTEEKLLGWHHSLFQTGYSGFHKIDVGKYRSVGMKVVSGNFGREKFHFEAPTAERVPLEMNKFLDWVNDENQLDLVHKAFIAHLWFVTIHPFDDGNGRLARAILDKFLAKSEQSNIRFYSLSNQIYKEHKRYNEIIELTQKGDLDITEYILWFLGCLERTLQGCEQNLEIILENARFWDINKHIKINDRQRMVLNYQFDQFNNEVGFLRTSSYAKLAKCSTDTALRDLQDLVSKNIVIVENSGKKTNYILCTPSRLRIPKISAEK